MPFVRRGAGSFEPFRDCFLLINIRLTFNEDRIAILVVDREPVLVE